MPSHPRIDPRAARASLRLILVCLATATSAAADTPNITGHVVDRDTREAIADAFVFAAVPAPTRGADVRRFDHVAVTRTDERGAFAFDEGDATGAGFPSLAWWRSWFAPPRLARYHAYHPSYGLVWGREAADGRVRITLSLRDAHLRRPEARAFCPSSRTPQAEAETQATPEDALRETIRREACPPADPDRYANGRPRARGEVDEHGRRHGAWRFLRADGSLQAEGRYDTGAATGDWVFHPAPAR